MRGVGIGAIEVHGLGISNSFQRVSLEAALVLAGDPDQLLNHVKGTIS